MTKTIENLFFFTAVYTAVIPLLLFIVLLTKGKIPRVFVIISIYSLLEFILNLVSPLLKGRLINDFYSGFTIIEYTLFVSVLYLLIENKKVKKSILFISPVFIVFCILYFIYAKYVFLDSIPIGIETILILTFSFYYLFEQLQNVTDELIYHRFSFWLVGAIMIYLAGSFFIYVFANQIDAKALNEYWMFTNIFSTLKNLLFGLAMVVFLKQLKAQNSSNAQNNFVYSRLNQFI